MSLVFGLELGMGSVDTVCDMSIRHVSHGRPMDVAQSACTPLQIEGNFHDHFIHFVVYTYLISITTSTSINQCPALID